MDSYVIGFIRSSLVWLAVGVAFGVWMVFDANAVAYRPAHMHANLLGFVSMMIFGVAYHVIPRFSGAPLHSKTAPRVHVFLANTGLLGMVAGFVARVSDYGLGSMLLRSGALLSTAGVLLFIINIWRTVGRASVVTITAKRPA